MYMMIIFMFVFELSNNCIITIIKYYNYYWIITCCPIHIRCTKYERIQDTS